MASLAAASLLRSGARRLTRRSGVAFSIPLIRSTGGVRAADSVIASPVFVAAPCFRRCRDSCAVFRRTEILKMCIGTSAGPPRVSWTGSSGSVKIRDWCEHQSVHSAVIRR